MRAFSYHDVGVHQVLLAGMRRHGTTADVVARMPYHALYDSFLDETWCQDFAEILEDRKDVWDGEGTHDTNPLVDELRRVLVPGEFALTELGDGGPMYAGRGVGTYLVHLPSNTQSRMVLTWSHRNVGIAALDLPLNRKLEEYAVLGVFAGKVDDLVNEVESYDEETGVVDVNSEDSGYLTCANLMLVKGFARIALFTDGVKVRYSTFRGPTQKVLTPQRARSFRHPALYGERRTIQWGEYHEAAPLLMLRPFVNW